MRTKIEHKHLEGDDLVEILKLGLIDEGFEEDSDELESMMKSITDFIINDDKEYKKQLKVETAFSALNSFANVTKKSADDDFFYYEHSTNINGRDIIFSSERYIKDECICDRSYDFNSVYEVLKHKITEKEYLTDELNKINEEINEYQNKLNDLIKKSEDIKHQLKNLEDE